MEFLKQTVALNQQIRQLSKYGFTRDLIIGQVLVFGEGGKKGHYMVLFSQVFGYKLNWNN